MSDTQASTGSSPVIFTILIGNIAHLVERWFEKPKAAGSIPAVSTTHKSETWRNGTSATPYEGVGYRFESYRFHHSILQNFIFQPDSR